MLEKNPLMKHHNHVNKIIDMINVHQNWMENLIEIRTDVVHYFDRLFVLFFK